MITNPTENKEKNFSCELRRKLSLSSEGEKNGCQPSANHAQCKSEVLAEFYAIYYFIQALFAEGNSQVSNLVISDLTTPPAQKGV